MTIYDHWLYRFLTGPLNNVAWLYISAASAMR